MKFSISFAVSVFCLSICTTFSAYSATGKANAIGFHFCMDGNCPSSKPSFSECGKNSYSKDGKCICAKGFVGDGKNCIISACPDGKYSILDKNGSEVCQFCPEGYFCKNGAKEGCPSDSTSQTGSASCEKCPEGMYSVPGISTCCPDGQKYDKDLKECVVCLKGESCNCPDSAPYSDGQGNCIECTRNEQCSSGFCSKQSCCPKNSSPFPGNGEPLDNGCYCQAGYSPDFNNEKCVASPCFQVEHSSEDGKGDATSVNGCFCDINYPHWHNGRCMRAKDCSVLMEHYGFKKGVDFQEPYKKDDQTFLNTVYVPRSFRTTSDMDLTGCNLWVDGEFQNSHKLVVDSLYINFSKFVYDDRDAKNTGTITTKGLTASRLINAGTIVAPEASVNFGYLNNLGDMFVDSIYELNDSPCIIKNTGTITVAKDFLFGAISDAGSVQNSGKIITGENWDSNSLYNWGEIVVNKEMNTKDKEIYDEGKILVKNNETNN